VGDYDAGTACSASCGGGTTLRRRTITSDVSGSEYGATACPILTATSPCNTKPCPTDCAMNDWSTWGSCSNPCTCAGCPVGIQKRTRDQRSAAANGGAACPPATDSKNCNSNPCPIDCEMSQWSDYGECSQVCGGSGVHSRFRTVQKPAQFGGVDCPVASLTDVAPCNTQPCPIDCVQTDWSDWSDCSLPCGTGTQQRARTTTTQPDYGGIVCGVNIAEQECNKQDCPVDCQVSDWTAWGDCDQPCGTGSFARKRTITKPAAFGGQKCPELSDLGACNTQECPVDKLGVLIHRIRHLELQDRVGSLEEAAVQSAQASVAKTAFDLASQSAVSAISLKESAHTHSQATTTTTSTQHLRTMHPTVVAAAHPYLRPSVTQLLQSEMVVNELAKFAERHKKIERNNKASTLKSEL